MLCNGRGMGMRESYSPISMSQCCLFSTAAAGRDIMRATAQLDGAFTC